MPPGMSFTAVSPKALEFASKSSMPRNYWDWSSRRGEIHYKWYCGTGPINMIFGLREAIDMILEETLEKAAERHARIAGGVRAAIRKWSEGGEMELNALSENEQANSVSTILVSNKINVKSLVDFSRKKYNVALSHGLGKLEGKSFRIGHMGYVNEAMILGVLGSIEMSFRALEIPHEPGGVMAAIEEFTK